MQRRDLARAIDLCMQTNSSPPHYHSVLLVTILRVDDTLRGPAAWARSLGDLKGGVELPSVSI